MTLSQVKLLAIAIVVCLLQFAPALADNRTMSFNNAVQVVPAPGVVAIDGHDEDWDLSAGVWSYNDPTVVEQYSIWTHLMWDEKGVYFLARYHDLSPMKNATSGADFHKSWQADCYQARVIFDDGAQNDEHQMHVNMFYSNPDRRPYLLVKHGGFGRRDETGPDRPEQLKRWGADMEAAGGKIAVTPWADGKGYNVEAFWPWSYCRTSGKPLKPGEAFTFGMEAMWGSADGTTMTHRLADLVKDDSVNRIFMFRARKGWGRAVLRDRGQLDITQQQKELQKIRFKRFVDYDTYGSVPIAYELPDNRDVSIVIDDAQGNRVRCLFGQYPREAGQVIDKWDGLDDAGNPVKPGQYTATVLHHKPIELKFFNSVYSSATPPWRTDAGMKLWGANHGHPTSVATRGKHTILLFTGTEGASGMQLVNDQGVIQWADGNEFLDAALDDTYVYGLSRSSWQNKTLLFRLRLTDGAIVPFDDPDRTPNPLLFPDTEVSTESTLALGHGKLWALLPGRALLRLNPTTGAIEATLEIGDLVALTDRDGALFGLTRDGAVVRLDAQLKPTKVFSAAGLKQPVRLGVSQDQTRFAISDFGTNQVLIFDAHGSRKHAIGQPYAGEARPAGKFVTTDLIKPLGADFDHVGRLWITEASMTCKRVTHWSKDYALVDQFWGQADYGATSGFAVTYDSTRFIAHGVEFKLDPDPQPMIRKTNEQPLIYHPELARGQRGFVCRYKGHDYACGTPGFNGLHPMTIFKRDVDGVFRACARVSPAGGRRQPPANGWVDRNDNGKEDPDEITGGVAAAFMYWSNGWVRPDMVYVTTNGNRFEPQGFSEGGVPLYDFSKPKRVANWVTVKDRAGSRGSPVMDMAGNVSDGIAYHTVDGRKGSWPNLYGRHDAPAAQRGVLIAPFRTNGVVEDVPGVGSMTALGGDRGEWFLMSMDGVYLSNICQDIKGKVVLDDTYIGSESFGGFIWRDAATGKVLVQLGGPSYRLMEVMNLDTCVRRSIALNVTADAITEGLRIARSRQESAAGEPHQLTIARVRQAPDAAPPIAQPLSRPLIDGAPDVRVVERGNPQRWFRAAMAIARQEFVVAYQVADDSPWKNGAGQFTHAFIGGDAVDLQLDVPGRGPIRMLVANIGGENTAVYWQSKSGTPSNATTYAVANNLSNATRFDVVKRLDTAKIKVNAGPGGYTVLLRVPLKDLGMDAALGKSIKGIVGTIYSDPSGTNRAARLYWHNKETGMVADVPTESRLAVGKWGPIVVDR